MNSPHINFEAPEKSLWTLMLTNPDGHLEKENSEYIHWLVYELKVFINLNRKKFYQNFNNVNLKFLTNYFKFKVVTLTKSLKILENFFKKILYFENLYNNLKNFV